MPSGRNEKQVTLYERDGKIYRRVTKELGAGAPVVVSDGVIDEDATEFAQRYPNAHIEGYHPQHDIAVPDPTRFNLDQLPGFVADIDSIDVLFKLRSMDDRKMSEEIYRDRIDEVLSAELQDEENEEETEGSEEG